jgi:protein-S-isoprenylcysteine O-methyltransferase Ste14
MTLLKSALFTIVVPGTVVVVAPFVLLSTGHTPHPASSSALRIPGTILAFLGVALYFTCLVGFVHRGGGTPSPTDPPRRLVVSGPYRYTRNPMYLAVLSAVAGEALYFGSLRLGIYAALLAVAFHAFVLLYEEPTLTRLYGTEYGAYRLAVPRWVGRRHFPLR